MKRIAKAKAEMKTMTIQVPTAPKYGAQFTLSVQRIIRWIEAKGSTHWEPHYRERGRPARTERAARTGSWKDKSSSGRGLRARRPRSQYWRVSYLFAPGTRHC